MTITGPLPVDATGTTRRTRTARRWFDWHSWLGVTGGLLLFIICWSGSFATLSHEFDWLVNPALRVSPSGPPADMTAIYDAVAETMPEATIGAIQKPLYPVFAADVIVLMPDKTIRHVYVDPYTLAIRGSTSYFNLQRFFRDFHMNFYGLVGAGKYVVGIMSIPLIGSLITGLFFYKRWWRRFFDIQLGRGSKVFWSSLHKVAGLWSLWFVLVIGITGLWYLYEEVRVDHIDRKFSYVDTVPSAVNPLPRIEVTEDERLPFAELIGRVRTARPDLDIRQVAANRGGYFYVLGQAGHLLVRDRANKVFVNPRDGTVAYSQRATDLSPYWRWSNTTDPLHFGSFGGLTTKIIWFVFGLLLSGLALTGAWLHLKRLYRDQNRRQYRRGTVVGGIASIGILLFCIVASIVYAVHASPAAGDQKMGLEATPGVAIFAGFWSLATIAIATIWLFALLRVTNAARATSV